MFASVPNAKNCFGLDIGFDSIKIAQFEKKGNDIYVHGLNTLPIPPNSFTRTGINNADKISSTILQAINSSKPNRINSKTVISALPESLVFTKIITLPVMKPTELDKAIQFEAAEILPSPIENFTLDWQIINEKANAVPQSVNSTAMQTTKPVDSPSNRLRTDPLISPLEPSKEPIKDETKNSTKDMENDDTKDDTEKKESPKTKKELTSTPTALQDILVVAAPKQLVESMQTLFKKSGLHLIALETKPIATSRALLKPDEKKGILLLDIGAEATSISIIDDNILHFTGTVAAGGNSITRAIALSQSISEQEAESRKKTIGLDINIKKDKEILVNTLSPIIEEINRAIRYYHTRIEATGRITTIRITGGTANLIAINPIIADGTGCHVETGNPLVNITKLLPNYTPLIMRPYGVAIGCALRPFME